MVLPIAPNGARFAAARAILLAGAILGSHAPPPARAQAAPVEPGTAAAAAVRINPTGRVLDMTVPLHYESFYLGDLEVRILPDDSILVPTPALAGAVRPLLRPEALAALEAALKPDGSGYAPLAAAGRAGFDLHFDPAAVGIRIKPSLAQKAVGHLSLGAREDDASPNLIEPALMSAYLNMRGAADYIARTPSGREGLTAPRLDLDGAMRWQGFVVEAEATFETDDASLFGDAGEGSKRRGTRLVRDFEEEAVRVTAGDVEPVGTSFQYTPDLLGIGIERSYAKLQPGRSTRATSRRSFRIERPSSVDVQLNGVTVRRLSLDAGDYDLADLPVGLGLSDVTLVIEDDTGRRDRLEFSIFLDSDLLEPGISEWGLAAGVPARIEHGEPGYRSGEPFVTGFYRRGLTEALTGETHLQLDGETAMGGLGLLLGTPLGLLSFEGAASLTEAGAAGFAMDAHFAAASFDDAAGRRHTLRLSAQAASPDFTAAIPGDAATAPGEGPDFGDWLTLSASYGTELPFHVSAYLTAGYGFADAEHGDGYQADLTLARPLGQELSLGLAGGYYARQGGETDLNLMASLSWRPDRQTSLTAQFDTRSGRTSLGYDRRSETQGVGSWQTSIDIAREAPDFEGSDAAGHVAVNGGASYQGNRADISLSQQSRLAGVDTDSIDQRTSLRIETAIAYADGHVAVGRPVGSGFAIVAPVAGLAENPVSIGKRELGLTAHTDMLGPALVPSMPAYAANRIDFDVDDLPPGYDLGEGLFDLRPKYRSGYALTVGSAYTVTAIGTLLAGDGRPVALLTGTAREAAHPEKTVELFTNREGQFSAGGLAPGTWRIEIGGDAPLRYELDIPADAVGLHRLGELRPLASGGGGS
jgi:outer membrane usher protein